MQKQQRTRVAAYALLAQEKRILLCRLSPEVPKWAGYWTLPGGGIDFGESPEDAMVREVKEETGLDVEPVSLAGVDSILLQKEDEDLHGIRIVYHVKVTGGELRAELSGTTDLCQWHALSLQNEKLVELVKISLPHL